MSNGRNDRGRHRLRWLGDRYVCSARGCPFTDPNLTLALLHCTTANKAKAA